jgi:hypothetical protein
VAAADYQFKPDEGDRGQSVYAQAVVGSTRRPVFLGVCTTLSNGLLGTNVKTISSHGQWLWWCMTEQRSSLLIPETRRDTSVEAETSGGGRLTHRHVDRHLPAALWLPGLELFIRRPPRSA